MRWSHALVGRAAERGTLRRTVAEHWGDCPASDAVFIPAMLAWRAEGTTSPDRVWDVAG